MRERLRALVRLFQAALQEGRLRLSPPWALVLKVSLLLPALALVFGAGMITFSNQPRFCISCHYMKPFYDAWKTSSHNHVKCVDCHIPPGARHWLQHKAAASVQVVKYVTRQYGTKPWTEVDDAACLRSGCHETRLLTGKVEFGGVAFDHGPHLTSFRRVTRLRCTSCHAQIVQGTHMTVTESTCFLCHFKNTQDEPEMANCRRCHENIKAHRRTDVPSEAWVRQQPELKEQTKIPAYDHAEVEARDVDCRFCHNNLVRGEGNVPRDRCLTCHTEPARLAKYSDPEFMHRKHVTDNKVECARCHLEIEHKLPPRDQTPELNCAACHPGQHAEARALYRGEGGHGGQGGPNPMFDVRVPCEGCHVSHEPVDGQRITMRSSAAGCMLCHGEQYGQPLARWQAQAVAWTAWAKDGLARTEAALNAAGGATPPGRQLLEQARENLKLVVNGHFVHNPDYAVSLLRTARERAHGALAQVGAPYRWPAEPVVAKVPAKAGPKCLSCHSDAATQTGFAFGSTFEHRTHVAKAGLDCTQCHRAGDVPETKGHGKLVVERSDCRACHERQGGESPHEPGWEVLHGPRARLDAKSCETCHSAAACDGCHGTRIPHAADWARQHGRAAKPATCQRCHQQSFCAACHRSARPTDHRADWTRRHGGAARQKPARCARCHDQSYCDSCHGQRLPHSQSFRASHGEAAAADPAKCSRCHGAQDCNRCHQRKPPPTHQRADWPRTHGNLGQRKPGLCAMCHGQNSCNGCHGTTMPHPAGWTLGGHTAAAQRDRKMCARCHTESYCQQCHASGDKRS